MVSSFVLLFSAAAASAEVNAAAPANVQHKTSIADARLVRASHHKMKRHTQPHTYFPFCFPKAQARDARDF